MKGADVNTPTTSPMSPEQGHRNRLMTVMLPVLLMAYVAVPLAAMRK